MKSSLMEGIRDNAALARGTWNEVFFTRGNKYGLIPVEIDDTLKELHKRRFPGFLAFPIFFFLGTLNKDRFSTFK